MQVIDKVKTNNADKNFLYSYQQIKAKDIKADASYNRPISKKQVENIVSKFDKNLVNPCKVSYRDGQYWIFDGNHTLRSLIEMHNNDDNFFVDCKVYEGMTKQDEAMMFALQNGVSRKVSGEYSLRAKNVANDHDVIKFKEATYKAGAKIDFTNRHKNYYIRCCNFAFDIYMNYGENHYINVIKTIVLAKNGEENSLRKEIIGGVDIILRAFPKLDVDRLITKLREADIDKIVANGKSDEFHRGLSRFGAQIGLLYNKKLTENNKLDLTVL